MRPVNSSWLLCYLEIEEVVMEEFEGVAVGNREATDVMLRRGVGVYEVCCSVCY